MDEPYQNQKYDKTATKTKKKKNFLLFHPPLLNYGPPQRSNYVHRPYKADTDL